MVAYYRVLQNEQTPYLEEVILLFRWVLHCYYKYFLSKWEGYIGHREKGETVRTSRVCASAANLGQKHMKR